MKRLLSFFARQKWYFPAFALPAFLLFCAYGFAGTVPFGEKSVLVLDLAGQYVWYLEAFRDAFLGDGGLIYSLSRSLGGEFLGILAYYLASPFSFLVLFFPKTEIQIAVYLILLLKTGASGATMFFYLEKKGSSVHPVLRLGLSAAYALCGFAVAYQSNLMWTDALILLPFVIAGLERLIFTGARKSYTLSLALLMFCNYYIGYMVCLFCGFYFLGCTIAHKAELCPDFKHNFIKKTADFIISSLFTVLFAAPMWLPGLYALTLGKLGSASFSGLSGFRFSLADALPKLLPGTYDTLMENGLPFLYCGILVLLLLPLYFCSEKYGNAEKCVRGGGMLLLFLSMWLNFTDMVWHGFRAPNCLNFRYAFLLVFLMVTTAAKGLAAPPRKIRKPVLTVAGVLLALTIPVFVFSDKVAYPIPFLVLTLSGTLFSSVLLCLFFSRKAARKPIFAGALCAVLCLELAANAVLTFRAMDEDVGFARYDAFRADFADLLDKKQLLSALDDSLYRAETTEHARSNDNMGAGLYGVSGSTSTLHAASLALLSGLGYPAASHWSSYVAPNPFADALLGIRYCISGSAPEGYTEVADGIYRNDMALSFCYRVADTAFSFGNNAAKNCNALAKTLTGADLGEIFRAAEDEKYYYIGGTLYDAAENSLVLVRSAGEEATAMVFTVTADTDGDFWFLLPSAAATRVILTCNEKNEPLFDRAKGYFVYLGRFTAGETVRVQLTFGDETEALTFYRDEPHFYSFSRETCDAYLSVLSESQVQFDSHTNSRFDGSLTAKSENETYLLSLPYDPCLCVYVDGVRTGTFPALGGLTGFCVADTGTHTVTVRYVPATLFAGILLFGLSVPAWWFFERYTEIQKRRKKSCSTS